MKNQTDKLKPCAWHDPVDLLYMAWHEWHEWAEKKHRKGERQRQCPDCKRWFFDEEYGNRRKGGKDD